LLDIGVVVEFVDGAAKHISAFIDHHGAIS
jgi:hypothetical protein